MSAQPNRSSSELWAITAYFNPMRYRRKAANYRLFREHLNMPLLAVELAYGPDFELTAQDAERLVQIRGHDILWQKERLLNLALQALPATCSKVVWVDCDVLFESKDWQERTSRMLERMPVVQPYSHLHRMPRDWQPGHGRPADVELRRSAPFLIAEGASLADCLAVPAEGIGCSLGYAWAATREVLDKHSLYDACVIGGADSTIVRAAYGLFDDAIRLHDMNGERSQHYMRWATGFHDSVRGNVGFAEGNVLHLWHGRSEDRRYRERNAGLRRFQFDPDKDIALDANGVWRWNSDKRELHAYVRDYFAGRREDG